MVHRLLALLLLTSFAAAQDQGAPWSFDDVVRQESVMGVELSRDGTRVLWQLRRCDVDKDALRTKLFVSAASGGEPRQLLFGEEDDEGASFSPDGRAIAFLSARKPARGQSADEDAKGNEEGDDDTPQQVWILRMDGGEPRCVTNFPLGVSAVSWSGPRELLITARERRDWVSEELERVKDKAVLVEELQEWRSAATHLFRLTLDEDYASDIQVRLTRDADQLVAVNVSPDGRRAVLTRIQSPQHEVDGRDPPHITLLDTRTGVQTAIFTAKRNRPLAFAWAPDSSGFYAEMPRSSVDGATTAAVLDVVWFDAEGAPVPCNLHWERGVMPASILATEDGFLALLMDGAVPQAVRVVRKGAECSVNRLKIEALGHVHQWVRAQSVNQVLFAAGTASRPDRWCLATLVGNSFDNVREAYAPNEGFAEKRIAEARMVQWTGAQGERIEGILFSPVGARGALPLVVMPHGGPFAHDMDRFEESYAYAPNLYTQRGARVLYVNYHGSSGYGLAFGESIRGRYYELELIDILSGINNLVNLGLVDAKRLAVAGWSNGAILGTALVSMADVFAPEYKLTFKACIHGAGDVNWTSDYGNCAFGVVFDDFYMGGPPWKLPDTYVRKSPLFHVEKVTTPTLIFFGTEDTAVPTAQGHEWHRALQQLGKAPVRFILFPGEEHALRKPSFWKRKLVEEFAWMDRYFFETPAATAQFADDAPIADLLASRAYARSNGVLGEMRADVLVPETVSVGAVAFGRFEVTRAQWRAVFPETAVEVGSEDAPMVGLSAEAAQLYVAELSKRVGETWRLLTEEEWDELPVGPEENTFSAWLGYEPPAPALPALRAAAADAPALLGLPPLLQKVGQRRSGALRRGTDLLRFHDVGGNAAEWVLDSQGAPRVCGLSALSVEDVDGEPEPAMPAYIGLRVARGKPAAK